MPRNMSFMLTKEQMRDKSKTVTRRLGWWFLKPGEIVNAVEKCQGLKKGEKVQHIGQIKILHTAPECLSIITPAECVFEGFPDMEPVDFVHMFIKANKCEMTAMVNRISFLHI